MNRFETLVQETIDLGNDSYLQKAKNTDERNYSLLYRENGRYSQPVELSYGIENEEDIDQLMLQAQENGIKQFLEGENR